MIYQSTIKYYKIFDHCNISFYFLNDYIIIFCSFNHVKTTLYMLVIILIYLILKIYINLFDHYIIFLEILIHKQWYKIIILIINIIIYSSMNKISLVNFNNLFLLKQT